MAYDKPRATNIYVLNCDKKIVYVFVFVLENFDISLNLGHLVYLPPHFSFYNNDDIAMSY